MIPRRAAINPWFTAVLLCTLVGDARSCRMRRKNTFVSSHQQHEVKTLLAGNKAAFAPEGEDTALDRFLTYQTADRHW